MMQKCDEITRVKDQIRTHLGQYLTRFGRTAGPGKNFRCFSKSHEDKDPSCGIVKSAPELFHCFSCLKSDELVWSLDGWQKINDVEIADEVWDGYATPSVIVQKQHSRKKVVELKLDNCADPLVLTSDHPCLYIHKDEAISKLPYLQRDKDRGLKFYGKLKNNKRCYKSHPDNSIKVTEGKTSSIKPGDYILFPILRNLGAEAIDCGIAIECADIIKPYSSGPRTERLTIIPVNAKTARLFGLWLAEGSSTSEGRNAVFTFNSDEEFTLAEEIRSTLEGLGLRSSKHVDKKSHKCDIICSKVDLVTVLTHYFGCGAGNKKIPGFCYTWPDYLKEALLQGYIDGDGSKGNHPITVSKTLAIGIRTLAIQLRKPVSLRLSPEHTDSKGVHHRDAWIINLLAKENSTSFFEEIGDTLYYWSSVERVADSGEMADVIDIEVSGSHTFVSKIGMVHNCGLTGDIFTAAHYLESKPIEGPDFIKETVTHLAGMFAVPMPDLKELTDEEKEELREFEAYRAAMQIILATDPKKTPQAVANKLAVYKWKDQTIKDLGVGWVVSFEDYWNRMITLGYDAKFLAKVDLDNKMIFNNHSLIFTVKDEWGHPVGFAARNLLYEKQLKEYEENKAKVQASGWSDAEIRKPSKYFNSTQSLRNGAAVNQIYHKGSRLFGFSEARKHAGPLWTFEGYTDVVTAVDRGLLCSCGIGSTKFTKEHLAILLSTNQKDIVFILDPDAAGKLGTKSFMDLVETELGDHEGLKVRVVEMPATPPDDPDAFIRKKGLPAFEALPKLDAFDWKVTWDLSEGKSVDEVCEKAIPLIVNEPNNLVRWRKAGQLSLHTGHPQDVIWKEIVRRVDLDAAAVHAERTLLVQKVSKELSKNPAAVQSIMRDAELQLEALDKRARGFDKEAVGKYLSALIETYKSNVTNIEIPTGWRLFDDKLGGIPNGDCFITIPGKMNQGKALEMAARLKTPTGWITMKDVKVGDLMASVDGQASYVTGVFPQGERKAYEITFVDGRKVVCCEEHLWEVQFFQQYAVGYGDEVHNGWKVMNTEAIRTFCLNKDGHSRHKEVFIPVVDGDFGTHTNLPIDPWLLGVLLGDGAITTGTPYLSSSDQEIVSKVGKLISIWGLKPKRNGKYDWRLSGNNNGKSNPLMDLLRELGLQGKDCFTKFIPEEYLLSNRANRLSLLQGLMDTDGTIGKTKETSFTSCSKELAEGVQQLVWSLGGVASISSKRKTFTYKGEKRVGALAYQVNIRMSNKSELFTLPRKKERAGLNNRQPLLLIKDVKYVGVKEMQCITVSHPSHLYITDNYIVTHNTSLLANLVVRLVENQDIIVFAHSVDDSLSWFVPRLFGVKYGFPSTWFRKVGYYKENKGNFKLSDHTILDVPGASDLTFSQAWERSGKWLEGLLEEERLVLADNSILPGTIPAFENWVKAIRHRHPDKKLVCCGDNFHIYELPGVEDGERKVRMMSQYVKSIANRFHTTIIMTMELPKESLRPGYRPRVSNIKGTSGIAYDANLNMGVYNDMKDFPSEPKLLWSNPKQHGNVFDSPDAVQITGRPCPVLELVFDKVKTGSSFCGSLFYNFDPDSGYLEECTETDQKKFQDLANEPDHRPWRQNPNAFKPGGGQ